ncbi:MAG: UPF0158 family protein [Acidobacteriota bacterium]
MARQIDIDLDQLDLAFENSSFETFYFLDLETGFLEVVTQEARQLLDEVNDRVFDVAGKERVPFEQAVNELDTEDGLKDEVMEARQIMSAVGSRYLQVPREDVHEGFHDMTEYVETVQDQRLKDALLFALRGARPFRQFKDVLATSRIESDRWEDFKKARRRGRALKWLRDQGIEPIVDGAPL